MSKKDIKHICKLSEPRIRKRDGEMLTHYVQVALTTDEAVALSLHFDRVKKEDHPTSLIRAFLINQSLDGIDENKLVEIMATLKLKSALAEKLSRSDFDKAMSFIKNPPQKQLPPEPTKTAHKRVYIPEPRRR
jgi:hypothetical protein